MKKAGRPRQLKLARKETKWFFILISPWIFGFLTFTAYPMLASLYYSFTNWDIFSVPQLAGLKNYQALLNDKTFWKALGNTLYYAALYVPLNMAISIVVAALLNRQSKGFRLFRTLFYIPTLIPVVVTSLLFFQLLAPKGGLVNQILAMLGIQGPEWFFSEKWAKPALVCMSLWGLGTGFILILSGMQGVPKELYESARIDGASGLQAFRNITLPMLSPVVFYNLVMGIISSLQIFTQTFVIGTNNLMPGGTAGSGGGQNNSLLSIVQYLYLNAFRKFQMGYASAIAWVLFVIILLLTALVFRFSALWTFYEGEVK